MTSSRMRSLRREESENQKTEKMEWTAKRISRWRRKARVEEKPNQKHKLNRRRSQRRAAEEGRPTWKTMSKSMQELKMVKMLRQRRRSQKPVVVRRRQGPRRRRSLRLRAREDQLGQRADKFL